MAIKFIEGGIKFIEGGAVDLSALATRGVALDGAHQGPIMHGDGDRWSFDHHAGCERLITLATCEQIRTVLCLGGAGWFTGREVVVNDLDGDTLMSLWLIRYPTRANEDKVRTLVRAVGTVDSHGPAGALLLSKEENEIATRFFRVAIKPVTDLRGRVREAFPQWESLVKECLRGITVLLDCDPPAGYEPVEEDLTVTDEVLVGGCNTFAIGKSDGWGFGSLYRRGWDGGILYKEAAGGTWTYTVAKRSDLSPLPIGPATKEGTLLHRLSKEESGWGGGSSIGGSPRLEGGRSSVLTPQQVWEIVKEVFSRVSPV